MKIYRYTLTTLDFLFYAKESLVGATTPEYLHATTLNYAVASALNLSLDEQCYIMKEKNGKGSQNEIRYANSLIPRASFYFTPARPDPYRPLKRVPQIIKGERDGYIVKGAAGEVLRASQVFLTAPESRFGGYVFVKEESELPCIIRLGRFRAKAKVEYGKELKTRARATNKLVEHPVDPLVSKAKRGVMINMFPYPIVENALCEDCLEIREGGFTKYVTLPRGFAD